MVYDIKEFSHLKINTLDISFLACNVTFSLILSLVIFSFGYNCISVWECNPYNRHDSVYGDVITLHIFPQPLSFIFCSWLRLVLSKFIDDNINRNKPAEDRGNCASVLKSLEGQGFISDMKYSNSSKLCQRLHVDLFILFLGTVFRMQQFSPRQQHVICPSAWWDLWSWSLVFPFFLSLFRISQEKCSTSSN